MCSVSVCFSFAPFTALVLFLCVVGGVVTDRLTVSAFILNVTTIITVIKITVIVITFPLGQCLICVILSFCWFCTSPSIEHGRNYSII